MESGANSVIMGGGWHLSNLPSSYLKKWIVRKFHYKVLPCRDWPWRESLLRGWPVDLPKPVSWPWESPSGWTLSWWTGGLVLPAPQAGWGHRPSPASPCQPRPGWPAHQGLSAGHGRTGRSQSTAKSPTGDWSALVTSQRGSPLGGSALWDS